MPPVLTTHIPELPRYTQSAKCATCTIWGTRSCLVATDRVSAFDVVLPTGIPNKGKVLTQLSRFLV